MKKIKNLLEKFQKGFLTVSYTHLDVYKRQELVLMYDKKSLKTNFSSFFFFDAKESKNQDCIFLLKNLPGQH